MARPMPDIAVLLAQVMVFVDESRSFWAHLAAGTEEVVADDPAALTRMLAQHDETRADLETLEQLIATREDVVRDVFRSQVGVCGEMSALLVSLAADETAPLRRAQMMDMATTMQSLGRQLAATALNVDAGSPSRQTAAATWTPRVIPGGSNPVRS